jgi:hypothetical protein
LGILSVDLCFNNPIKFADPIKDLTKSSLFFDFEIFFEIEKISARAFGVFKSS